MEDNQGTPQGGEDMSSAMNALAGLDISSDTANQINEQATAQPAQEAPVQTSLLGDDSALGGEPAGNQNAGEQAPPAGEAAPAGEAPQGNEGAPATQESLNDLPTGEEAAAGPTGDEAPAGSQELKITNPLTGEITIGDPNEGASSNEGAVSFESIDDVSSYLKEELGIDDISSLPTKIGEWKGQTEEIGNLSKKVANAESVFKNLDPDLYEAVVKNTKGEDWRDSLQNNSINFSKAKTDYDDRQLVEGLAPGKLTESDWEEYNDEDGDPAVKRLVQTHIDNAKVAFDNKKQSIAKAAENSVVKAQEQQQAFSDSLTRSKEALKARFGNADQSFIDDIENKFTEAGIASVFYDDKGLLREDAFVRLAMAEQGTDLIDQYQKIAERKIETRMNQEILARGADAPSTSQGSNAATNRDEVRKEVQDIADEISGLVN